jgi:lipopolysaccharide/colanic/teichoic acid biosynthesis glycosyltransferase
VSVFRTFVEASESVKFPADERTVRAVRFQPAIRWTVREYACKRLLDWALATAGLVISTPLWLLIACAIKLEDGGPVFYLQQRWGRNKRPFKVYKFRSMVVGADGSVQAGENDSRFTGVGGFLRATSLDELPQLVNIWRGEMSWVGPRALPINEKQLNETSTLPDTTIPGFDLRCAVRPGLTGVAQVFGPRDMLRRQKFRYDCFYIRQQSIWLDLKLIAMSIWISLRLRWEGRRSKVRKHRGQGRIR